jgi:hypothetical protein
MAAIGLVSFALFRRVFWEAFTARLQRGMDDVKLVGDDRFTAANSAN